MSTNYILLKNQFRFWLNGGFTDDEVRCNSGCSVEQILELLTGELHVSFLTYSEHHCLFILICFSDHALLLLKTSHHLQHKEYRL